MEINQILFGFLYVSLYLGIVSFFPLLLVWKKSKNNKNAPKSRKYILSIAIVLMNLSLILFIGRGVSLGYGSNFYRANLRKFSEVLDKGTDENAFNYLQQLKENPMNSVKMKLPEPKKEVTE